MANQLNITVGADVGGAISGLTQLENKTTQAFAKVKQSSGAAQQTVLNFGRVLQDAPYAVIAGNIGAIANNIDPLVESFGRARAQGGTFTGTLKSIGASLIGPAGIGLAITAVSSALVLWGDKIFGSSKRSKEYTDALSALSVQKKILAGETLSGAEAEKVQTTEIQKQVEQLKKLNQAIKESSKSYKERQSEATGSVQEEISLVSSLATVVQNQSLSYEQRNNALTKLKSINQAYFGDLSLEAASLKTLTERVNQYTQALVAQEVLKGYTKNIADLTIANNNTTRSVEELTAKQTELQTKLNRTPKYLETLRRESDGLSSVATRVTVVNEQYTQLSTELDDVTTQLNAQNAALNKGKTALQGLSVDINKAAEEASKFQPLNVNTKTVKDKTNEIIAEGKRLAAELAKIGAVVPEFSATQTKAQQLKLAQGFINQFKTAKVEFNVTPVIDESKIDAPDLLGDQGVLTEAQKNAQRDGAILGVAFNEGVTNALNTGGAVKPENIRFRKFVADYENLKAAIQANNEVIAGSINDVVGQAFGNLFNALKQGENAFRAFAQGVGTALLSVIERLIATAATAAVLSFIFPGGVGGAQGFGNIFKSLIGFRANGGPVTGRSPYIVGERGPELFVPSVSGNIVPNNQLGAFNGRPAFAAAMGGRSIVRGTDILLASARTQRSINRVNA